VTFRNRALIIACWLPNEHYRRVPLAEAVASSSALEIQVQSSAINRARPSLQPAS